MKRACISTIVLSLIFVITAVSCGGFGGDPNPDPKGLVVLSNVSSVASRGAGIGHPVEGVLLAYHNGNGQKTETGEKLNDDNIFYVEFLGETRTTWYGMDFNYILWVPQVIQDVYEAGNGVNPESGNPFWWYMLNYYGSGINNIRNDWKKTIQFLMHNRNLTMPNAVDVKGNWNKNYLEAALETEDSSDVKLADNIALYGHWSEDGKTYCTATNIEYYSEPQFNDGKNAKVQIFMPSEVSYAYYAGSGENSLSNALLWYLETYFGKKPEAVLAAYSDGTLGQLIDGCSYIKPNGKDVPRVIKTHEVLGTTTDLTSDYYFLLSVHLYSSDILTKDGEPILDKERVFFQLGEKKGGDDTIIIYVPQAYFDQLDAIVQSHSGKHLDYSGNMIWRFVDYCCTPEEKGSPDSSKFQVSKAVINKLMQYRASEGLTDLTVKQPE